MYLFNRKLLAKGASPPTAKPLQPTELQGTTADMGTPYSSNSSSVDSHLLGHFACHRPVPTSPPASTSLLTDVSASPLLRALAGYESHFLHHRAQGEVYAEGAAARAQSIHACATQVRTQQTALHAALENLRVRTLAAVVAHVALMMLTPCITHACVYVLPLCHRVIVEH